MKRAGTRLLAYTLLMSMFLSSFSIPVYAEETESIEDQTIDETAFESKTETVIEESILLESETESIILETEIEMMESEIIDEMYLTEETAVITGFEPLTEGERKYILNKADKPSLEQFLEALPKTLSVIFENGETAVIDVWWECTDEAFDTSESYYFHFTPKWDKTKYVLSEGLDLINDAPYVAVFLTDDGTQTTPVTSLKNETTIYNFLKTEMNLNTAAACGILANIYKESSFNPNAGGDGGTSYGICQWHNQRFTSMKNWCTENDYDYKSLEGQLNYLKRELSDNKYLWNGKTIYEKISTVENTAEGAYQAAYYWCKLYEVPADTENSSKKRGVLARDTYWPVYKNDTASDNSGSSGDDTTDDDTVSDVTYKITFNANGGTGGPKYQTKTKGQTMTITSLEPTRSLTVKFDADGGECAVTSKDLNFTFKGWNTKSDGTGSLYAAGAPYKTDGEITLYAQWEAPVIGELPEAERDGYIFAGWFTKGGERVSPNRTVMVEQTYYAHWTDEQTYGNIKDFVTRLYNVCLNREPDEAGLADWTAQLSKKQITGIKAAYGFVFSPEFKAKNLCNEDYVKQLYQAFLGRDYDAAGLADWVGQLEQGKTREEIFNGFALSQEFKGLCEQYGITQGYRIAVPAYGTVPAGNCSMCGKEDGVTGFVKRLYRVCLNREADAEGLKDWTGKLRNRTESGRDVAYGFIFSPEFTNKKYVNEDYVEYLYEAFMGRSSDETGKNDWLNRMKNGWSRKQVFDGFVGSQEFDNICKSYGIVRD